MQRTYSSIAKIRAGLSWVNETPDPNKCGCRNVRCCEETGTIPEPAVVAGTDNPNSCAGWSPLLQALRYMAKPENSLLNTGLFAWLLSISRYAAPWTIAGREMKLRAGSAQARGN